MQGRAQNLIDTFISYTGSVMQWTFLSEAGRGMLQRRTEFATDALIAAHENNEAYYIAPTSRLFASPTLVVVDPAC